MLSLIAQAPRPAAAWQAPPSAIPVDVELPWLRIDFKHDTPGADALPIDFYQGEVHTAATASITPRGLVDLPEISIGHRLDPRLLELLGSDGMTCALETAQGVLTRDPRSAAHRAVSDEILWRVRLPGAADHAHDTGWVEVKVPERVSSGNPGTLKLSIHGWSRLRTRVGAGVFRGALLLTLKNARLQGGEPLRLSQPLTVVIAGSRVVAAELEPKGEKAFRVGTRPVARVEIESVTTAKTAEPDELDPGWWLQLDQTGRDGPPCLARFPLPFRENKAAGSVLFRMGEAGDDRCWDTVETPDGYYRDENWKNEVILQHVERSSKQPAPGDVSVLRYTISTYLPDCFQTGTIEGEVSWDPTATGKPVPRHPDRPAGEVATSKLLGPIEVLSGLRASTDMPVTGEIFWVWAVIDLGAIPNGESLAEGLPRELSADVWKDDAASKEWKVSRSVQLVRQEPSPIEPKVVRYRNDPDAELLLTLEKTGRYKIKLATGNEPTPEGQPRTAPPKELIALLADAEVSLRVVLEGEAEAPRFDREHPLKVFTDRQPFWWGFTGEPGFTPPHENVRDPEPGQYQVTSTRAIGFRWAASLGDKLMKLRFQGFFHEQTDPTDPAPAGEPIAVGKRYDNVQPPNPHLAMIGRSGDKPDDHEPVAEAADPVDLKEGADVPRRYYDVHVDLNSDSAVRQQARKSGTRPLLARFVVIGIDGEGKPFGRAYVHRFDLAVMSIWDEIGRTLNPEVLGLVVVVLVLGILFLSNRAAKRKRKARAATAAAAAQVAQDQSPTATGGDGDYLSGLDPTPPDQHGHDQPVHHPPPKTPSGPAPAAPSYLDNLPSGPEDGGGPSYLD
jgi:hypothetical protein